MKKRLFSTFLIFLLAAASVLPAFAATPVVDEFDDQFSYWVASCEGFEIVNYADYHIKLTFFPSKDGSLDQVHQQINGVDVLTNTANGKAVPSEFSLYSVYKDIYPSGTPETLIQAGVFWKLNGPDGHIWFQAGQYDVTFGPDWEVTSEEFVGADNLNTDALCALLA
jgi:hypothetical protein